MRDIADQMCGTLFSPLALMTVVPPSDVVEETFVPDQAPLVQQPWQLRTRRGWGQVIQLPGLTALPPVAIILMKSAGHSG